MKSGASALLLASFLVSAPAFARPTARLTVEHGEGAEACPSAEDLRRSVIERMGYDALRPDADAAIDVLFRVEKSTEGSPTFSAKVTQRDNRGLAAGERVLADEGSDCAGVAEAVVLTVSVLLESTALPPRREASPPAAAPPPEAPADHAAAPPTASLRPHLRAEGTASFGVAPATAPGVSLAAGVRRRALSLDLEGRADLSAEDSFPGGRVRTSVRMAELVPCGHVGIFAGCALAGAGVLAVEGLDVHNARSDVRFHAVAGLRVAVEPSLGGGFFLSAHADALVTLTRTTVGVGSHDLWTTPPLGASFGAGVGYAFR